MRLTAPRDAVKAYRKHLEKCMPSDEDVENAPKDKRAKEMREFRKNVSVYDKIRNEKRSADRRKAEITGENCDCCDEDLT